MADTMKVGLKDEKAIADFIKQMLITPMEKGMTGQIKIHFLNGVIRGCEINYMSRNMSEIKNIMED